MYTKYSIKCILNIVSKAAHRVRHWDRKAEQCVTRTPSLPHLTHLTHHTSHTSHIHKLTTQYHMFPTVHASRLPQPINLV